MVHSMPFRYVWPAELDLMARIAGMTCANAGATGTAPPSPSESPKHISVWQKPSP